MEFGVSEIVVNSTPVSGGLQNFTATDAEAWRMFGAGQRAQSGVQVTAKTAMGYPPLWRAINVISDDVAGLPLDVYRRSGESKRTADVRHPGYLLLSDDSDEWTHGETLRKTLTSHAMLYGNGMAIIERDYSMNPISLTLVDPQSTMIRMYDGRLWYIIHTAEGELRIQARDMLHIKGLSHDGIRGLNVIDVMKNALGVGMAAQEFGGRFFGGGSNAGGLLMIPGHFSEEKIRNTLSAWDKMATGLAKAHKVALLQDGVKYQQLTVNPDQSQFLETRQYEIRSTVASIFGLPPHMLGDDSRTSHNSLEQEDQNYLTRALNPWLKEWERECRRKLISEKDRKSRKVWFEFNREALIQMSFQDKIGGLYKQVEMGMLSMNEARAIMNLTDIGEDGDIRYHPANWVQLGHEEEMMAQPPKPESNPQEQTVLRAMIATTVTKHLSVERDRVVRAAKMRGDFCSAIDSIYSTWTSTFGDHLGWSNASVIAAVAKHAEESRRQLLDVAGGSTTQTLAGNVSDLMTCWDERGQILINKLCEAAQ